MTALHPVEHRRHRHHRLAGAHVALQETVHRVPLRQVGSDRPDGLALGSGELEREALDERRYKATRRRVVEDADGAGGHGALLADEQ